MENEVKKKIEEMMKTTECPKDFICYKSGLEDLCKAKDFGAQSFLECLEGNPRECPFSITLRAPLETASFCECPLRVYICHKLEK